MNKGISILVVGSGLLAAFLLGKCSGGERSSVASQMHAENHEHDVEEVWTCSMHPQIQQAESGSCPICGMDLTPLVGIDSQGADSYRMTPAARALAEVETSLVERRMPELRIRLVGTLDVDETLVKSIAARFPARIEDLFVNYTGISVKKGEHIARIYSPELLTAERELLLAYERHGDGGSFVESARQKLRRWGLEEDQIDEIRDRGDSSDKFELRSPISGVVSKKLVREGDYLEEGSVLYEIADYSRLWLMLDAYESDLSWLSLGQRIEFSVEAYPGEVFEGRIVFIAPEIDRVSRTSHVRVNVSNAQGRLKPGMFATGFATALVANNGSVYAPEFAGKWISPMHPEIVKDAPGQCDVCGMDLVPAETLGYAASGSGDAPLVIPSSAVLRTGERSIVYIESSTGEDTLYEGREVVLGQRAGEYFTVVSGLEVGERVVTRGAFKIDSALQILAKRSMMSPNLEVADEDSISVSDLSVDEAQRGMEAYLELGTALAADDLLASKASIQKLHDAMGHASSLDQTLHALMEAEDLDTMRRPHFDELSQAFVKAVEANAAAFEGVVVRMNCPMVYPDRGGDWLQGNSDLKNPYFGASMLTCGEIVRVY